MFLLVLAGVRVVCDGIIKTTSGDTIESVHVGPSGGKKAGLGGSLESGAPRCSAP